MATNYAFRANAPTTVTATAFTSASTSAVSLGDPRPARVAMTCDKDCYVRFGSSSVGAATSSYWPIWAKTTVTFDITPDVTHFRVIRASEDGTLSWGPVA